MRKAGKEIITGAEQGLAYLKGDKTKGRAYKVRARDIDVKAIRQKLDMTQEVFSETFAIPVSTLKRWETNNRVPEGPTKAYLTVIDKTPCVKRSSAQRCVITDGMEIKVRKSCHFNLASSIY